MPSLQESINKHGILTPLTVRELSTGKYKLIDGFNRIGCVSGDAEVPCVIINGEPGTHMIKKSDIWRKR